MLNSLKYLLSGVFAVVMLLVFVLDANAYSTGNHEKSVRKGAKMCLSTHGIKIGKKDLKNIIKGVLEPDEPSLSGAQMVKQRFERGSWGAQRNIVITRIAAQSIHASPNPTRTVYTSSARDKALLKKTIRVPSSELMPNRFPIDVYSYDTNQGVRNKILINASQFMCVSFAHQKNKQSARKFGNMLHMIGDTYSASHVQRSAPVGSKDNCGTEKIEWHYSMDLISWKQHVSADKQSKDWRFRCLVKHASNLMKIWVNGRDEVRKASSRAAKLKATNANVKKTLQLLCKSVLREDANVLSKPAGGAAAGYSSASGTDLWKLGKKKKKDQAIQPVGLTGIDEAKAFYKNVSARLRAKGSSAYFSYPSRNMKDLCKGLEGSRPLPKPLQCTPLEIDMASHGSKEVKTMWIPARSLR